MHQRNMAIWVGRPYDNDALFTVDNKIDVDDRWSPFRLLRSELSMLGWDCHTQDVCWAKGIVPEVVLFLDIPFSPLDRLLGDWSGKTQKWVMLQENAMIMPHNWDVRNHAQFDLVFTWNDSLVDNSRYFKFNNPNLFPEALAFDALKKDRFCTVIAGNHRVDHPMELYSARADAIRWFEHNHPEDFDLYGRGWTEYVFQGCRPVRALNRLRFLKKLLARPFPSYRGEVGQKRPVLERYKYCICYENARDFTGYISEKIFDAFFAGCVPVYWGAPNVLDHIPAECFVDKRRFPDYGALYAYLKGISEEDHALRLKAIEVFLKGEKGFLFSNEAYVGTIVSHLPGGRQRS